MRRGRLLSLLVVMTVAVVACSASASETFSEIASGLDDGGEASFERTTSASSGDAAAPEAEEAQSEDAPEPSESAAGLGDGGLTPVAYQASPPGRDIIFTAEVVVAVSDVGTASAEAGRIVAQAGGFLFGQHTTGSPNPSSTLTFKVDPARFHEVLVDLSEIGEVRTQNVSATDVTDRVVDLESQITTAASSVERLRALLAEATDIKEVVALEAELVARETQLESLRGQLRTLADQVALATIVLTITEAASNPEIELLVTAYPSADDGGAGCPGEFEYVGIETGTLATLCYEVINTGDTLLGSFELRDPVLDITIEDMTVVYGSLGESLEPGASVMMTTDIAVERGLRSQTTVTAQPLNADGTAIEGAPATRTAIFAVEAVDPGGIPTFVDGLETSWEWLVSLGQILLLAVGALLPFVWIPVGVYAIWRLVGRSRSPKLADDA